MAIDCTSFFVLAAALAIDAIIAVWRRFQR